jgi:hypothetical protein
VNRPRFRICVSVFVLFFAVTDAVAANRRRVVVVTLDGVRWQEIFRGAEAALAKDESYVRTPADIAREFVDVPDRARTLTPFLHDVVARQGMLIGDRDHGSCGEVANPYWFSYPGYNELFTGRPDPAVSSNDKIDNPNKTILEWLDGRPEFRGKIRAFGSWDVFPYILNRKRSGLPINAAFDAVTPPRTPGEAMLNRVQAGIPSPWGTVRYDALTFNYALESLRNDHPVALYISLGEPDEYAHEGHYDRYLQSIRRCDGFLRELWTALQSDPEYAGQTTLVVTTDHGRGEGPKWRNHGSGRDAKGVVADPDDVTPGSDQTWFAMIGPEISPDKAKGYGPDRCAKLEQVAATILVALGLDWHAFDAKIAPPLQK